MKLIHLSDLHLGKRVNEFSLLPDQKYILEQILRLVETETPDGVLLAGDIYDKSVPPAEAVELFDDFLTRLAERGGQVFVISGNHDSPERIAFGGRLMELRGVHMCPVYDGSVRPVTLRDEYGAVNIYMLPFLKPAHVRRFFPEAGVESYTDALRVAIEHLAPEETARNVLITHQFVTGAGRSDSEEAAVGGADNVDAAVFAPFDYVALGHLHRAQSCGEERLRYCGTPLKYSFSEAGDHKSVTIVQLGEKGTLAVRTAPLTPRRDMRELRGSYEELTRKSFYDGTTLRQDYLHITLTEEEDVPEAMNRLRAIYPYLMKLDYDNRRTRAPGGVTAAGAVEKKTPLALFAELYERQNGQPMSQTQREFISGLIEEVREARE